MKQTLLVAIVAAAVALAGCRSKQNAPPRAPDAHAHQGHQEHAQHQAPHAQHGGGMPSDHRFEDAEEWATRFEDPERDAWQKPDEVIAAMEIPHGGKVADIGAATGYFPVRIARGHPDALVYGVDIEPDMVRYLGERAAKEGLSNLKPVQGSAESANLPEAVDRILLVNTYHHISERPAYFGRLAKSLKPGGRIIVVDYKLESSRGPAHKMAPEQVIEEMTSAGYQKTGQRDLPQQYVLIFERN